MRKITLLTVLFALATDLARAKVDLVKVDKSERKMYLLERGKVIKEYNIVLGANPKGHKQKEGDQRTPEGTYILDYKKEDSSFYRAMHISYPNEEDIKNAEEKGYDPGGHIMIHGQRNRFGAFAYITQQFDWTDGCIALSNTEIDEFISLVEVGTTIQIEW